MKAVREPIFRLALILTPALFCSFGTANLNDPAVILERFRQASERQKAEVCEYSVNRTYTLTNKHLSHPAKMFFTITYDKGAGKKFKLLSEENTNTLIRHTILDLIDGEIASSSVDSSKSELDQQNYKFWLMGKEAAAGRSCYKIRLEPRSKGKYLLDGIAWIDSALFTVVKIQGQPAKGISFWVSHPQFEQDFAPVQSFWMPSYNHSTAHITFFGDTDLTIEYADYQVQACRSQPTEAAAKGS